MPSSLKILLTSRSFGCAHMVCQLENIDVNSTGGTFYHGQTAGTCSCHDGLRVLPVRFELIEGRSHPIYHEHINLRPAVCMLFWLL